MNKTVNFSRIQIKENDWNITLTYSYLNIISIDIVNKKNKEIIGCIYDIKYNNFSRISDSKYMHYLKNSMNKFIYKSKKLYLNENGL